MLVRLINPYEAELAQLDTVATAGDPDGVGMLTSGYDPDFHEPIVFTNPSGVRTSARREKSPTIRVPCQIEPLMFEALQQFANGDSPDSRVVLCFRFHDLKKLGLVNTTTGETMIRKGDRLNAIYQRCGGPLVQTIRQPPGLYVTQSAIGAGIGRGATTLIVTFEDREGGARSLG
jgi:hypothetical protein